VKSAFVRELLQVILSQYVVPKIGEKKKNLRKKERKVCIHAVIL